VADDGPIPALAHDVTGTLGAGVPMVLLHAFPLERSMWSPVVARLSAAGVPVITADLPGLGGSPLPDGPPSLDVSADAVAALLDRLAVPRAVVCGVSMGGYVALAIARRHPARPAGLGLIDTKAQADADEARANRERIALAVLGEAGNRALAPMIDGLLGPTSHAARPEVVERVRAGLAAARPQGVAWSQRAMAARPDATGLLAAIGVPVAVLVGAEDALTPPAVAHDLVAGLPDAVLSVLPRVGHLSPIEDPDAVAAALLALLLRIRPHRPAAAGAARPAD
jgi:pimeloyl-ACP methyl ester carboxylesterase